MRDVKDLAHLTNAKIAAEADVSINTIERIMAINIDQDIRRATARRIELAIIGQVGEFSCHLDHDPAAVEKIAELQKRITELTNERDRYAKIIDRYFN